MTRRYLLSSFAVLLILNPVLPAVRVLQPDSISASYSASQFVRYGPQVMNITGSAIFLQGRELCAPRKEVVSGAIVFSDQAGYYCTYGAAYQRLNEAGAKAFILFDLWDPPGIFMFQHESWSPCAFCNDNLVIVGMYWGYEKSIATSWKRSSRVQPLVLEIAPPFDQSCRVVETSVAWLVILRIIAPIFAFATASSAAMSMWNRGRQSRAWTVGSVILVTEIPINIVVGIALACGQSGNMVLPVAFHSAVFNLLSGFGLLLGVLLALFLTEEARVHHLGLARRSLVKHYRVFIVVCVFLYGGTDLALFINHLALFSSPSFPGGKSYLLVIVLFQFIVIFPGYLLLSSFYAYVGYGLRVPFCMYAREPSSIEGQVDHISEHVGRARTRIGRLAFWLVISGACSILSAIFFVALQLLAITPPRDDPRTYFVLFALFSYFRIGMSFSQIQAIKPNRAKRIVALRDLLERTFPDGSFTPTGRRFQLHVIEEERLSSR